jgi:hypothetical protein
MKIEQDRTIYNNYEEFFKELFFPDQNKKIPREDLLLPAEDMPEDIAWHGISHGLQNRLKNFNNFIFRGEATSAFKLIPNIFREPCNEDNISNNHHRLSDYSPNILLMNCKDDSESWYIEYEYQMLVKFFKIANHEGLLLPYVHMFHHSHMKYSFSSAYLEEQTTTRQWYSDEIAHLAALAQHHGCLTRMLDWSYNILIALYFAAVDAINRHYKLKSAYQDQYLRIWALDSFLLSANGETIKNSPLQSIIPSYHDNQNLRAQEGLLVYRSARLDNGESWENKRIDKTPLDDWIYAKNTKCYWSPLIYQFLIPTSDRLKIVLKLRELGITTAKLFPGFDGVTKQMQEDLMIRELYNW